MLRAIRTEPMTLEANEVIQEMAHPADAYRTLPEPESAASFDC